MEPLPGRYVLPPANQAELMAKKGRQGKQRRQSDKDTGTRRGQGRRRQKISMPFEARNYALMVAGLVVVGIGYAIMAVEQEVDGFLSLYISPILLIAGYLEIIYAIVWRPKDAVTDSQ